MPVSSFVAIIRRVVFLIVNKVLKWLLPIPLFPAVSSVLANMVGINPFTLNSVALPKLPGISVIPATPKLPSVIPGLPVLPDQLVPPEIDLSETIPLGEKVSTWRQRHLVAENAANDQENIIQLAQKINRKSLGEGKTKRERIDHIDFDNPLGRVAKVVPEAKTAIRDVVPQVHLHSIV
jgi:hypothetical protein